MRRPADKARNRRNVWICQVFVTRRGGMQRSLNATVFTNRATKYPFQTWQPENPAGSARRLISRRGPTDGRWMCQIDGVGQA
jgi:hypothetical protein